MMLSDLSTGECGTVVTVRGDGEISVRLMEMGLTPGVDVRLIGTAPLGDPLELEVRGYRLSVRRQEAAHVEIRRSE